MLHLTSVVNWLCEDLMQVGKAVWATGVAAVGQGVQVGMPGNSWGCDTFWNVAGMGVDMGRGGIEGDIIKAEKVKLMSGGLGCRLMGGAGKMGLDVQDEWADGK